MEHTAGALPNLSFHRRKAGGEVGVAGTGVSQSIDIAECLSYNVRTMRGIMYANFSMRDKR